MHSELLAAFPYGSSFQNTLQVQFYCRKNIKCMLKFRIVNSSRNSGTNFSLSAYTNQTEIFMSISVLKYVALFFGYKILLARHLVSLHNADAC
jgi:hypothetical protein